MTNNDIVMIRIFDQVNQRNYDTLKNSNITEFMTKKIIGDRVAFIIDYINNHI